MSASLIAETVLVFSASEVVVFWRAIAVGASLTSVIVSVKFAIASGVEPTLVSSTLTVTE